MRKLEDLYEIQTKSLENHYVCAGNRALVVGAQNGLFPDFGHHVANEMGGVWDHPIKLLDGFWLHIADEQRDVEGQWLTEATEFKNYPMYNEHRYACEGMELEVIRRQFVPDDVEGVVVRYRIRDLAKKAPRSVNLSFLGRTDLSPVWFSDELGIQDGPDEGNLDDEAHLFVGKDSVHPWFVVFGSNLAYEHGVVEKDLFGPEKTAGQGVSAQLTYTNLAVPAGGTLDVFFFIAGSYKSEATAKETFSQIQANHQQMFEQKHKRYQSILKNPEINVPDEHLNKVLIWVKFHTDWLIREVPEIGRGLGAGHPEYSWWFGCDNSYSLLGVLALGDFQLVEDTIQLLAEVSEKENGNGRIVHEISTFGGVSNLGNTQETPHFIKLLWDVFLWTGNIDFLRKYYPLAKKGMQWILDEKDVDGDLYPEGYGIIEIEGLNLELIDSAVYTHEAMLATANMAEVLGESETAATYRNLAQQLKKGIERDWWLEDEGLYADARGTSTLLATRIDKIIERARQNDNGGAVTTLERLREEVLNSSNPDEERSFEFKNWVINTPLEVGIAPRERALRALSRMATDEFTGPFGTYLSGLNRSHMMTISTGVQAVAEAQYDRMDEALKYMQLIASTYGKYLPASISEMSPDYGCFVQAWTVYGLYWPLLTHMFGVRPEAHKRVVNLRPRLPFAWNDMSVKHVSVGSGPTSMQFDVAVSKEAQQIIYKIDAATSDWVIRLNIPNEFSGRVFLDGQTADVQATDDGRILEFSTGTSHEIRCEH